MTSGKQGRRFEIMLCCTYLLTLCFFFFPAPGNGLFYRLHYLGKVVFQSYLTFAEVHSRNEASDGSSLIDCKLTAVL